MSKMAKPILYELKKFRLNKPYFLHLYCIKFCLGEFNRQVYSFICGNYVYMLEWVFVWVGMCLGNTAGLDPGQ